MEQLTENLIPSEEIEISPVKFSTANLVRIQNPLLRNKGSVGLTKSKKELSSYSLVPPTSASKFCSISDDYDNSVRKSLQTTNSPDVPILGSIDNDATSITSEMSPSERFNKPNEYFQLPMFEVRNTMCSLRYIRSVTMIKRSENKAEDKEEAKKETELLHKMWTISVDKRNKVEDMTAELMPKQREYFTIMSKFKNNYLNHVLSCNKVYFQYVLMSRQNLDFLESEEFLKERELNLLQKEKYLKNLFKCHDKKTLVLDLDETLILATNKKPLFNDTIITYYSRGVPIKIYVKLRPFLKEFLEDMQEFYELIIYTSADKAYADAIIDYIERNGQYFSHRLYKDQCIIKEDKYLFKNLEILCGNRNLYDIVLVDNLVMNYSLSVRNGIPILDYEGEFDDYQLVHLADYLRGLAKESNLQEVINKDFAFSLLNRYEST